MSEKGDTERWDSGAMETPICGSQRLGHGARCAYSPYHSGTVQYVNFLLVVNKDDLPIGGNEKAGP